MPRKNKHKNKNMNAQESKLKEMKYVTFRLSLHDPIDGKVLCEKIAEDMNKILRSLLGSSLEKNIRLTQINVSFKPNKEDASGWFLVDALGLDARQE